MSSCDIPGTGDISDSGDNTSENIAPDSSTSIIDETTSGLENLTLEKFLSVFANEQVSKLTIDMISTENISQETVNTYFEDFNYCFEIEAVFIISTYEQTVTVAKKMGRYKSIDIGIVVPSVGNDEKVQYYKFYLMSPYASDSFGLTNVPDALPFMFAVPVDAQGNPV